MCGPKHLAGSVYPSSMTGVARKNEMTDMELGPSEPVLDPGTRTLEFVPPHEAAPSTQRHRKQGGDSLSERSDFSIIGILQRCR